MPFGLVNAPSTFCRLMHMVLHDLFYMICLCYLDDIIVYADTPEELIERLDTIFTRLREHGLKAKPTKCVLFKTPIDFLGHTVSAEGIEPQIEKLAAIRDWPTPHCLRDVRAFFGLASYYRRNRNHQALHRFCHPCITQHRMLILHKYYRPITHQSKLELDALLWSKSVSTTSSL